MPDYSFLPDLNVLMPEVPPESILSRTIFDDAHLRAVLFQFAPGQELSEHTATSPAVLHFLSGEGDLTLGGDALEAHPGTWAHMPPNLKHSIRARTPLTMLLLLIKDGA